MARLFAPLRNERGASLALVAISMVAMLAVMALAIDLGMLYKTRAEASRAAEAGALAGASVFLDLGVPEAEKVAQAEVLAVSVATQNYMTGAMVDPSEVTVEVLPDEEKVRVWVRRAAVGTWFARIIGIAQVPVGAMAAAEATESGTAKCVKPFLIPDFWEENTGEDDLAPNQIWDFPQGALPNKPGSCGDEWECWSYTPDEGDRYVRYGEGTDGNPATGIGSNFRDNSAIGLGPFAGNQYYEDVARPMMLYPSFPQYSPTPSNWYLWRLECPGANCVRDAMLGCSSPDIDVGDYLAAEQPGEARGAVQQGLEGWMDQDPSARFVEEDHVVNGTTYKRGNVVSDNPALNGDANPRVFIAALISPDFLAPGYDEVPINNLAKFFLETIPSSEGDKSPVQIRFLGFAQGFDEGPTSGTLIKTLRLVE